MIWLRSQKWKGDFFDFFFFYVRHSTLLHLPPLWFHCVGGCWNRTQDSCDYGIFLAVGRSNHLASSHPLEDEESKMLANPIFFFCILLADYAQECVGHSFVRSLISSFFRDVWIRNQRAIYPLTHPSPNLFLFSVHHQSSMSKKWQLITPNLTDRNKPPHLKDYSKPPH